MARTQIAISTDLVGGDLFTISVWDIVTGNVLSSYKSVSSLVVPPRCLDLIGDHFLVCTYQSSPILNVWSLAKKDHLNTKMILPGVVGALAVTSCGAYCLAGIESKIYIWQISSGQLLNVLEKHYQKVIALRITTDSTRFISAGEDGLVLVWDLAKCIVEQDSFSVTSGTSNQFDPIKTINNSAGKVTDLYLSPTASGTTRGGHFAVGSEDQHVKIYSLQSGDLLATILFDYPVRSVVMDRSERFVFTGLSSGDVAQTTLNDWVKVAPNGSSDGKVIDMTRHLGESSEQDPKTTTLTFQGHTGAVTCLAVTIDGHGLLSGSLDHTIKLWHIKSRQCMRTTTFKGAISNLLVSPALSGLFLYDTLESQQNLMEPLSNVTTDVSLSVPGSSKSSGSRTNQRISMFDQGKYTRPLTYDSLIKKAANPPPYIVAFKREIYRPSKLGASGSGNPLNAFENGVVFVNNDNRSGAEFWPWEEFTMPSQEDIERIFGAKKFPANIQNSSSSLSSSSFSKSSRNSKKMNLLNGSNGQQNGSSCNDTMAEDEEIGNGMFSSDERVNRLLEQNEKIYQFSIDHIFANLNK